MIFILTERQRNILKEIIINYSMSGHAVGSKYLLEAGGFNISSATVRNEMATLEKLGLIEKTHLSSGRVPSLAGFHYYFDNILRPIDISDDLRINIKSGLEKTKSREVDEIIRDSTKLLSEMTDYMSVYFSPEITDAWIEDFRIIQLQNKKIILIIGDNFGRVSERVISLITLKDKAINELSNIIKNNLIGKNLIKVKKYFKQLYLDGASKDIPKEIWLEAISVVDHLIEDHCYIDGAYNLFNYMQNEPPSVIQDVINFMNSKNKNFIDMMRKIGLSQKEKTNIQFIPNATNGRASDFILISTQFDTRYLESGLLAVVGPQMMPYSKIVTVVNIFRDEIQKQISAVENINEGV